LTVDEIRSLNTDDVHVTLTSEVETVVGVFDSFEAGEGERRFSNSTPNDGARINLVERLKENETVLDYDRELRK